MKHFFVSYTKADRTWAEWIAWQLQEAGYSVVIQAWHFREGENFIANIDQALKEAEVTLAVLTPKYFESRYTKAEWTAAFDKGNLLPVRVADFAVDGVLRCTCRAGRSTPRQDRRTNARCGLMKLL